MIVLSLGISFLLSTVVWQVNGSTSNDRQLRASWGGSGNNANKDPLRFIVMGDWGTFTAPKNNNNNNKRKLYNDEPDSVELLDAANNYNNGNGNNNNGGGNGQYWNVLVANAMATYASSNPIEFLIALGDNFYNNGVASTTDSLWTSVYSNVYTQNSLQVPWYAVFGNHDYGSNNALGSIQAQMDFSDGRWNAGQCYMKTFNVPGTSDYVDIVFIDTTAMGEFSFCTLPLFMLTRFCE